jgi:hypothetical protein
MALAKKITQAKYDALSDNLKAEYKKDGDGYTLDVEGEEDTGALKRAKEHEKAERIAAEKRLKEAQDELDRITGSSSEAVEKLKAKHAADLAARDARVAAVQKRTADALKATESGKLAAAISTMPKLMQRQIADRITVEFDAEDNPTVRVLGADGKPDPKLTLEQLGDEFRKDPEYSAIIRGSKATGGGSPNLGAGNGSAGNLGAGSGKPVILADMSNDALAAAIAAKAEAKG